MCLWVIIFDCRRIKRDGTVKVAMFLKIIVEQMSGHSIRGQSVCEIREKCTHIFHHCRTPPKKVSDDEGNGVVMTYARDYYWLSRIEIALHWWVIAVSGLCFSHLYIRMVGQVICRDNSSSKSSSFSPKSPLGTWMDFQWRFFLSCPSYLLYPSEYTLLKGTIVM